jgi:hypothetical protein
MKIILALLTMSFISCATANSINHISLGMSKAQVINEMGNPVSISAKGSVEYLNYSLYEEAISNPTPYFIRIIGGKVESYGRKGDFDSTKNPTIDMNITNK